MNTLLNSRMTGTRRIATAASAAVAVVFGALATNANADVAEAIPSDALFAIKINDIQSVSDDWGALAKEWGLDQMEPGMADPIAAIKGETGMGEGIDFDGEMGIYAPAGADFDGDEPPLVVLVPVSDYDAFLDSFEDRRKEGDYDLVTSPEGEDVYAKKVGDYAAMTPMMDLLGMGGELGLKMDGPSGDQFDEQDITLYANFVSLAPILNKAIEENGGKEKMIEELEKAFESGDVPEGFKQYQPVAKAAAGQAYMVLESFLRDAKAATVSVDFNPEAGIAGSVVAHFNEGSYLGDVMGNLKTSDGSLLSGLPEGNYLFFGGSAADPEQSTKLFTDLAGPVLEELQGLDGEVSELVGELVSSVEKALGATESARFGLFAPDVSRIGQAPLLQQVQITSGDPELLMDVARKGAEISPKLMQAIAAQAGEADAPDVGVKFEENAKEVAGVTFTKSTTELPQNDATQALITNLFFGPEGQTAYLGTVEDSFLSVSGLSDDQIASVVEAIKADASPLTEKNGMELMADNLPEDRSMVVFWDVGETARAGLGALQAFGQAPPIQIPQNLPPIGIAAGPAEDSLMIGVLVPKDLVSAAIVTTMQLQGGMGGPPNQGL